MKENVLVLKEKLFLYHMLSTYLHVQEVF